ncbi:MULTISPECIES: YxeA family protein [unclassified Exiguobacterium]|uniref:YxeA family protein n=1 Tax=unclassified Exiguobacterium TaxID=2644629 RepID=UPI001BE83037|nr:MULTISPECIES: YxeA family protein [unclassified Exiguobacterium]
MKKWIGIAIVSTVLMVGLTKVDWNRIGKDTLFVEIKGATDIEETTLENGEVMKRYVYTQPAFSSEGKSKEVTFTATKELREGAYLRLYVKDGDTVTSYEEVSRADVPRSITEK